MRKLEWLPGETLPAVEGYYMRKQANGAGSEIAWWSGSQWFHVSKSKQYGLLIAMAPHKDQRRQWREKAIKVEIEVLPEDRFGMLVVKRLIGVDQSKRTYAAVFKCDCGNEKQMNLYEVKSGRYLSCGCRRAAPETISKQKEGRAKWLAENKSSVDACNRRLGESRAGKEMPIGPAAKWAFNIHAEPWHFMHEDGRELKGWNLLNMIRENAQWFSADDLIWEKGMCRASKRLSNLRSRSPRRKPKSWKGWRLIDAQVS